MLFLRPTAWNQQRPARIAARSAAQQVKEPLLLLGRKDFLLAGKLFDDQRLHLLLARKDFFLFRLDHSEVGLLGRQAGR